MIGVATGRPLVPSDTDPTLLAPGIESPPSPPDDEEELTEAQYEAEAQRLAIEAQKEE